MTGKILAASLILGLGATALPAQAVDRDVRCFMAANVFSQAEKDAQKKQLALGASFFYLGRLDSRLSPAQLKAQIVAQSKSLNRANVAQTMNECAKSLATKQMAVAQIGQQLQQQQKAR
jgi:hypothetical protein